MPVIVIEHPDGDWVDAPLMWTTPNYDMLVAQVRVDGAAVRHDAALFQHGNCSIVYYRATRPDGSVLAKKNIVMAGTPHSLDPAMGNQVVPKTVSFAMCPEGTGLRFNLGGHLTNHTQNPEATVLVPNVWTPFPVGMHQIEDGKAGAFQPDGGLPPPEGEPVDYQRIEDSTEAVTGGQRGNSLKKQITTADNINLRPALRDDLHKDAELALLFGTDIKAQRFRDGWFDFNKNAAANPWANILLKQDAWGTMMHAALVATIAEGSHLTPEAADAKLQKAVEAFVSSQAKASMAPDSIEPNDLKGVIADDAFDAAFAPDVD